MLGNKVDFEDEEYQRLKNVRKDIKFYRNVSSI